MLFARETPHLERSPLNEVAHANIALMVATLDTSHFEMSPLKALAPSNILSMSVTLDTSHSPIGPCGPLEQSPFGDNFRHASISSLSSVLDEELEVDSQFMRRYQRHLGKVKFATTYEIGDEFPHFGHWKTEVDCKDSLYAYVCLPSYAGLINLGEFDGEPQFISFSDVGLLGVALRID